MSHPLVFISHESALDFWRSHDLSGAGGIKRTRRGSLRESTSNIHEIKPLLRSAMPKSGKIYGARCDDSLLTCLSDLEITSLPLHVMVSSADKRRKWSGMVTHLYKTPLPEDSFCKISDYVYVSSPELTLCQMATVLSPVDLLELCLEFCSGYALDPESERGFIDRPALTTSARLRTYVNHFKGRRGAKAIKAILPYVIDDSASPMETKVLMLLCLPSRLGGQQLPLPQHNVAIPITERAKSHTKRMHLVCDLWWEEFDLDVECDSTTHHSSESQLGIDSDRRIILDAMGYHHVGITTWQLEHAGEFLNVTQAIRRAMGLRVQRVPEHIAAKREALRNYLNTPQESRWNSTTFKNCA